MTMTEGLRTKIEAATAKLLPKMAINGHRRNRWTLEVMPDGAVTICERLTDNEWSVIGGDAARPVEVLLRVGTGSCNCNCDACSAGDDPSEWAGDDTEKLIVYEDEIARKLDEIPDGYWTSDSSR